MSRYLLLISIGPVQDFIAEARRTRDLWFGSHALSELSRAAAWKVADEGGALIFPALAMKDLELEPCNEPVRPSTGKPPLSIANKIQAEVTGSAETIADVASKARKAVKARWHEIDGIAKGRALACIQSGVDAVWNEQIDTLIEFYAVWAPLERPEDYRKVRGDLERSLAGRKNLREFRQWKAVRVGAPKSSLDGARVSVLKQGSDRLDKRFAQLRIPAGEQLSAVDLVKRAGFEPEQFVPIMNIAAAPWLVSLRGECDSALATLAEQCEAIDIKPVSGRSPAAAAFRYDASVFYPDRWPTLFEELGKPRSEAAAWGGIHVKEPILNKLKERKRPSSPASYVACLVADGDYVGKALDALAKTSDGAAAHRTFSKQLSRFASGARDIVENDTHLGSLVYSGGDDVLAFLPVATAFSCAEQLAKAFTGIMQDALPGHDVARPTLSVGIGIGHVMDAMGTLLDLGRQAEKAAKAAERNALAIVFDKRSGGTLSCAMKWNGNPTPLERLSADAGLLDSGRLAKGKVQELGAMLRRFKGLRKQTSRLGGMLDAYATVVLEQSGAGKVRLGELGLEEAVADFDARYDEMSRAVDRILIAKSLLANGFRIEQEGAAS